MADKKPVSDNLSKDAQVRQQSYMSERARIDKAVFEKVGIPIDFTVMPQPNEPSIWENLTNNATKVFEEFTKEAQDAVKQNIDEFRDNYDVLKEAAKDIIPSVGTVITPLDREIAKYYVTNQGIGDTLSRGILYPARGRALKKQRKEGTLNQYQVDNLEDLEKFMSDTLINTVFADELQGQQNRWNKLTAEEKKAGLTLVQARAERLRKNPLGKPKTAKDIRERLKIIFMGETQLGKQDKLGNLIDNPGGAVGLLQVEPSTFRDVVRQRQFGSKAAKASGLTQKDLNIITNTPDNKMNTLSKYLEQPKVNYMAATAKIFQYLKEHNL